MNRREFCQRATLALGGFCLAAGLRWPLAAQAAGPLLRLALLADAHLPDGNAGRPEARLLARAVAEIRALRTPPDLVLFAGDLAHDGNPKALALGREILADLPGPLLLVPGEGDRGPGVVGAWPRLFTEVPFLHSWRGVNLLGLDTAWEPTSHSPGFALGESQRRWLAATLPRLDPETPLLVLSHAPLGEIFRPWGQWTRDAHFITPLLSPFRRVVSVHGHIHHSGVSNEWSVVKDQWSTTRNCAHSLKPAFLSTQNPKPGTPNLPLPLPLPATAWPFPSPLQGTPRKLRPGLGPQGCGWVQLSVQGGAWEVQPHFWQA